MKTEEELIPLIQGLMKMNTLHQEYQNNDIHYVIDSQKEGNTLTIKVQLLENKDKEEFENWLKNVDDSLFEECLDELKDEGLYNLNEIYNSENYKEIIDKVKSKTKEIALRKIEKLQGLFN